LGELAVVNDELRRRKRECREALGAGEAKVRGESLRGQSLAELLRKFVGEQNFGGERSAKGGSCEVLRN
jgi:hypothetical protein